MTDSEHPLRTAVTTEAGCRTRQELAGDVLDCLLEGCQVIGRDWTNDYVNAAVAVQGRRSGDELVGRTMMRSALVGRGRDSKGGATRHGADQAAARV